MNNPIIDFLNLNPDEIESLSCDSLKNDFIVSLSLKRKPHACPKCSAITSKF